MPRHHRIRIREVNVDRFFENVTNHVFHDVANFLLRQERCFNINLRKFRLTVCTKVFITEALHNLVVTVKAGHHQQLFEQLRRLRQGVEMAVMDTARNQVVASAFRSAACQHRGFNINETLFVQVIANSQSNLVAQF